MFRLNSKFIQVTSLLIIVACTGCCMSSNVEPPKDWHHPPQQSELWGLKEISSDLYQQVKVGDPVSTIDKSAEKKGVDCYIFWLNRKSYQACFKVEKGVVTDKSIRQVKLVY